MTVQPQRPHVHIIDDVPAILELMREVLDEEGFQVSTRGDIPSDLSEIKTIQPGLIILDGLGPRRAAGWSLLEALKRDPDTCAIPIVLCTAAAHRVKAQAGNLAAMNVAVVLKPFAIGELLAVITESLLSCHQASSSQSDRLRTSPEVSSRVHAIPPVFTGRSPRFTATATLCS